jgi:lipoprotein signal peptidase
MMGTKRAVFIPAAAVALTLDQLGKLHVTRLLEAGARQPIIENVLAWTHVPSMGGAFGFFHDWLPGSQLVGFALLALAAACIVLFFYRGLAPGEQGSAAALGSILGGIASQTADRLRYGTGLDFLHVGPISSNTLPDFNVADIAIVLGVVTLIIELLASEMAARAAERPRI